MGNSQPPGDFQYAGPVPGTEEAKGETPVFRDVRFVNKPLLDSFHGSKTLQELVLYSAKKYANRPYLSWRQAPGGEYISITYQETHQIALNLGRGIWKLGLPTHQAEFENCKFDFVGIYSKNRREWAIFDQACALFRITCVPIYDTLGPEAVRFVYAQTNITTLFCTANFVEGIAKEAKAGQTNKLKNLVILDELTAETRAAIQAAGLTAYHFDEVVNAGKGVESELPKVTPDDIHTLSYTSGTTGVPKAAMLSHRNFICDVAAIDGHPDLQITEFDTTISYLPLAHVFERAIFIGSSSYGCRYAFYAGDVLKLKDDFRDARPTIFPSVPRLFNKIYDGIQKQFNEATGLKRKLIDRAVASKLHYLEHENALTHRVYDPLVFKKIKDAFGGNIRLVISASAPLSTEVLSFFKIAMQCPFVEAYGQTECGGVSTCTVAADRKVGLIGGPVVTCEIKLVDIPEMSYTSKDKDSEGRLMPRGELWLRGPCVIPGYYKDPEKTKEAITSDGWLKTGDIAVLHPNGALKLIDRKKNIFKLQQGEYVAPEKIENVYQTFPLVENAYVHGDSLQSHLVGIFYPNAVNFKKFAEGLGATGELKDMCKNDAVKKKFLEDLVAHGKKNKLLGFEQVKVVHLESEPFLNLNLLTPSFKLKRNDARKHFEKIIVDLYKVKIAERE